MSSNNNFSAMSANSSVWPKVVAFLNSFFDYLGDFFSGQKYKIENTLKENNKKTQNQK